MYFRTVRNHRSTSTALKICISRKSGPKTLVARIITPSFFFFFLKKRRGERKNFSNGVRIRVRDEPGLRSFRLKLIERRVIIPEFLTFHDPLVQDPRNLLGNCVKFRAIYRRFGPRVSIFFFFLYFGQHPEIHTISNVIPRERHRSSGDRR